MRTALMLLIVSALLAPCPAVAQGLFEDALAGSDEEEATQETAPQETAPREAAELDSGANANASSAGLTASLGGLSFELNGKIRAALYVGKVDGEDAAEVKAGYGEAALLLRARKGEWGDAFGELRLRGGLLGGEVTVEPDLREGYINLYLGPVDLRVGHQVIIWGRADGVNPTNNLTPMDMKLLSPYEDDMRLANLAVRAHLNLEIIPVRWEVVWVPFYRPTRLPNFQLPAGAEVVPGMPVSITLAEADYPDADITNGTLATRVHLLFSAVEASVSYLIGTSLLPGIALQAAGLTATGANVTMALTTYRHQVVGADFSTAILGVGVRGEVAYREPFGLETYVHAPRPEIAYVLGLDRELLEQVQVIAQYSGKTVLRWDDEPGSAKPETDAFRKMARPQVIARNQMIAGQLSQYQHGMTLRVAWNTLAETLHLELMGTYNFSTEELMLRPKITYDIADALAFVAGGQIYLGPDETMFGMIQESMSGGYIEVRASF